MRASNMGKLVRRLDVKKGTLQAIREGCKTLLVRVDDRIFTRFSPEDTIKICSGDRACTCRILAIRRYASLEELFAKEVLERIAHGSHEEARTYLLQIYLDVPPTHRFVVLELELIKIGHSTLARG